MKLCNNCQRELQDHQQVCPYCGEQQEPVQVRYRRREAPPETVEEVVYQPTNDRAKEIVGGFGLVLTSYFSYLRDKWSGKNIRQTSPIHSLITLFLFTLITAILANVIARGGFVNVIKSFGFILGFVVLSALVSFIIAKLLDRDRYGIVGYLFDFANYLILPMLLSLIGLIVGLLKGHNVAQIILFISLFFVFTAVVTKITRSDELDQPNFYPGLLIASLISAGMILFLSQMLF